METVYITANERSLFIKFSSHDAMMDSLSKNAEPRSFVYNSGRSVEVCMTVAGTNMQYVRIFDLPPELSDGVLLSVLGEYGKIDRIAREKFPVNLGLDHRAAKAEREHKKKMAEALAALQRQREFITSKVTRIKSSLQKADDEQVPLDEFVLETYIRTIDAAYQEMNECQTKMCATNPTKQEEEEEIYVEFENLFTEVRAVVSRLLNQKRDAQTSNALQRQVAVGVPQPIRVQQSILPHTPLPSFDGKPEHWFRFKSMFTDIMNKCANEDAATKLYHLDKCLVGEAAGVINQQFINENNYDAAWNFLVQRYEDKRKIVDIHANKLLHLKPMTQESGRQLRDLIEECKRHVDSLRYHGYDVLGLSDIVLVNVLASKLDFETKKLWEANNEHGVIPTYDDTIEFLEKHALVLERVEASSSIQQKTKSKANVPATSQKASQLKSSSFTVTAAETKCVFCDKEHFNHQCDEFLKLSPCERNARAKKAGRHHTVLHLDSPKPNDDASKTDSVKPVDSDNSSSLMSNVVTLSCATGSSGYKDVLLSTAVANILDVHGNVRLCRILLDSGSQLHLITEAMTTLLGIQREKCATSVVGINGKETHIKHQVMVMLQSRTTSYSENIECLVVPRITGILPAQELNIAEIAIPNDVRLADPEFNRPQRIDLLIGAELFYSILKSNRIDLGPGRPIIQETFLGWVVAGPTHNRSSNIQPQQCNTVSSETNHLDELVQRFYMVEDVPMASRLSEEEALCEQHYVQTTTRDSSGRYVVRLPFRDNVDKLGETKQHALQRFQQLERRLNSNEQLKREYDCFIEEYIRLNHCREVFEPEASSKPNCFLPHHAVLKPSSSSTKLRTVFDASAKSTLGLSLNDVLMTGPSVQDSLLDITMRFRVHQYVFTCDVPKMYRQVAMAAEDTKFLRVFYRKQSSDPIRTFELTTVTYGTASAPFSATRTLVQLVHDEGAQFPIAAEIVLHDVYIDDALTGGDSIEFIKEAAEQLVHLLERGGFQLHKWCSNSTEFLETIPEELKEKRTALEFSGANDVIKTLGLLWNPSTDELCFRMNPVQDQAVITKRHILSEVSKTFDPLGLFAPSVVLCKLLIRDLWKLEVGWDEEVPPDQMNSWMRYIASLKQAEGMKINRCVLSPNRIGLELHAFSDASFSAYGTCVYIRSVLPDGTAELHLLTSKSRVAPNQTIPRLELCGFVLMARLVGVVMAAIKQRFNKVVLWTDSTIVLCWLNKPPHQLNTFVSNRVTEINRTTKEYERKYVESKSNPADMLSRGVYPADLKINDVWWHGPTFLRTASFADFKEEEVVDIPDVKKVTCTAQECEGPYELL
ncbi:uncharacterized protein LOC115254876 [Aedes albopictus]|uniref:Peptidase aspartic putative domain-containing protein n=1 Tax=Aedes albopictus TaxID=7160 RepID=A0ABM1XTD8_AEDAL